MSNTWGKKNVGGCLMKGLASYEPACPWRVLLSHYELLPEGIVVILEFITSLLRDSSISYLML
jgi:hypothetical protein